MATAKDLNRKPLDTMWHLLGDRNGKTALDTENSFYVGKY